MTTYYTAEHEWLKIEDGVATVGITEHAQEALGDVVFVDLPEVGKSYAAQEVAGVTPREIPERPVALRLSGLEPFEAPA